MAGEALDDRARNPAAAAGKNFQSARRDLGNCWKLERREIMIPGMNSRNQEETKTGNSAHV